MYEKQFKSIFFEKLEVDKDGNYIIELKDKTKISVSLDEKEIETLENWFHVFSKHELRFEIWNILELFGELNITQISKLVEQSKSTVARHLRLMEKDQLILSRKAEDVQKGKIPPKLYSINQKLARIIEYTSIVQRAPTDPDELSSFIEKEIRMYYFTLYRFIRWLRMMEPLLQHLENNIGNVGKANKIYKKYFEFGKFDPFFSSPYYLNDKYYEKFLELLFDFIKKRNELMKEQNNDPEVKEKTYVYLSAVLPIKEYLKIYRMMQEKDYKK